MIFLDVTCLTRYISEAVLKTYFGKFNKKFNLFYSHMKIQNFSLYPLSFPQTHQIL